MSETWQKRAKTEDLWYFLMFNFLRQFYSYQARLVSVRSVDRVVVPTLQFFRWLYMELWDP